MTMMKTKVNGPRKKKTKAKKMIKTLLKKMKLRMMATTKTR